jgi:hypothetical protein
MRFCIRIACLVALCKVAHGEGTTECRGSGITEKTCLKQTCFCKSPCYYCPATGGSRGKPTSTGQGDNPQASGTSTEGGGSSSSGEDEDSIGSYTPDGASGSGTGGAGRIVSVGHCFNRRLADLAMTIHPDAKCWLSGRRLMSCCGEFCHTLEHLTEGACTATKHEQLRNFDAYACQWEANAGAGVPFHGLIVYQQVGPFARFLRMANSLIPESVRWFASTKPL